MTATYPISARPMSRTVSYGSAATHEPPTMTVHAAGSTEAHSLRARRIHPPLRALFVRMQEIVRQLDNADDIAAFRDDITAVAASDLDFLLYEWEETIAFDLEEPNAIVAIDLAIERRNRT